MRILRLELHGLHRLDPGLAEAHATLAYIKEAHDWDWAGAEEQYRRAIDLNPNQANARLWYALFLAIPRRYEEALGQIKRAEQLDPLSRPIKRSVALVHSWGGQFDQAIEHSQMTLELSHVTRNCRA